MSTANVPTARSHVPRAHRLVAALLVLHGVAHLVGTQDALRATEGAAVPYLFGAWEVGGVAAYPVAVAWVAPAIGFAYAATRLWALRPGWSRTLSVVTGTSLLLSVLALPQAVIGVTMDLVLLTLVWDWSPTTPRRRDR